MEKPSIKNILIMLGVAIGSIVIILAGLFAWAIFGEQVMLGGFCGYSTHCACETDTDCFTSGCSGQICTGWEDWPKYSGCDWEDCYDDKAYGIECGCVNGKCRWHK